MAFEAFYLAHESAVLRTVLAVTHDPMLSEEVTGDTFLRAYQAWDRLDPTRSPRPWLQRVAVNLAISRLRRRRPVLEPLESLRSLEPVETHVASGDPAGAWLDLEVLAAELRSALGSLTPEQRAAVVLHHVDGYPVREIAEILGRPPGTVRHWLRVALRAIRASLVERRRAEEASRGAGDARGAGRPGERWTAVAEGAQGSHA